MNLILGSLVLRQIEIAKEMQLDLVEMRFKCHGLQKDLEKEVSKNEALSDELTLLRHRLKNETSEQNNPDCQVGHHTKQDLSI